MCEGASQNAPEKNRGSPAQSAPCASAQLVSIESGMIGRSALMDPSGWHAPDHGSVVPLCERWALIASNWKNPKCRIRLCHKLLCRERSSQEAYCIVFNHPDRNARERERERERES